MREVCFILSDDKILRVYFGTGAKIPDQRDRWEVIWEHRQEITEIAHTHPGEFLGFSGEDLTTMEAVEAGTGRSYTWSVITRKGYLSRQGKTDVYRPDQPWWVELIRQLSYGRTTAEKQRKEKA